MHAAHNPVDFNDFTMDMVTLSRWLDNEHAHFSIKGAKWCVPLNVCKRVDSGQTIHFGELEKNRDMSDAKSWACDWPYKFLR